MPTGKFVTNFLKSNKIVIYDRHAIKILGMKIYSGKKQLQTYEDQPNIRYFNDTIMMDDCVITFQEDLCINYHRPPSRILNLVLILRIA